MTRRRWIADRWDEGEAMLTGDQAVHLARVLRAAPGMRCDVVAGERVWSAEVTSVSEQAVRFALLEELEAERALPMTLVLAIFKFDRMEWAIEKATELGVARMIPVVARRTEKHLAQAAVARVERWRRIAQEAAKQSRRADVPGIEDPCSVKVAAGMMPEALRLLLSEQERVRGLREMLEGAGEREVVAAVGPEGGWTNEEAQLFVSAGWWAVSLGPRVLRAETAAIAAVALMGAVLG